MDKNTIYKKDSNIVSRKIGDEFILVPIKNNVGDLENIYTLGEVGARIWELIDGENNVISIEQSIMDEFQVSEKEAQDDLVDFLYELEEINAIRSND